MSVPQVEELKHIILQHVSPEEHRERALHLLKTIEQRRYSRHPWPSDRLLLPRCRQCLR